MNLNLYFGNKQLLIYILLDPFHILKPIILYSDLKHFFWSLKNSHDVGNGPRMHVGEIIL